MTASSRREFDQERRLDEQYVQDAFHSFLKSSLAQAKAERLLDVRLLNNAEADLMVAGPALCLYFAALRSSTDPPSVPIPRRSGSRKEGSESSLRPDTERLSLTNCPVAFIPFLRLWSSCVPTIRNLAPEHRHDLARIICDLPPLVQPVYPVVNRVAADLRSISIEISQRRSFQDRYASDLQTALGVGGDDSTNSGHVKASFVPPPPYTPTPVYPYPEREKLRPRPLPSPEHPYSSSSPPHNANTLSFLSSNSSPLAPPQPSPPQTPPRQRTPTIATPTSPAIELIRETLYAALADVLESTPSLIPLLKDDPPRAYFSAVALAILSVSTQPPLTTSPSPDANSSKSDDSVVLGVRGVPLKLSECPAPLRPLMSEFSQIGRDAAHMEEEDTLVAIRLVQAGHEGLMAVPRLERARLLLERGAGYDVDDGSNGRRSAEGRAVAFANRVNALAFAMTRLPQFKERQDEVFRVLAGVGSSSK